MKKRTIPWIIAAALLASPIAASASVIGSMPGCNYASNDYTFCNSSFTAPVSGSSFQFDVLFPSGTFLEVLNSGWVDIDLFPAPSDALRAALSSITGSLLGTDGNVIGPTMAYSATPVDSLRFDSTANIVAGTRIGGIRTSMTCTEPDSSSSLCSTGMTFRSLAVTVQNGDPASEGGPRADSLRVGQVPEPATVALFGLGLAAIGYQRRKRAA